MSDQNKNRAAMKAVDATEDALANAIDKDFGDGAMAEARTRIGGSTPIRTPLAQKVAERIADHDESPAGQLKIMVEESRAKLADLDDKRVKLESYREVQIEEAIAAAKAKNDAARASITEHEKQVAQLWEDIRQADERESERIIKINADVDTQVDAIDQMEAWHRNVVETAAKNVTPRKAKRNQEEKEIPF